jgi:SAM-dependent methyltransferase
MDIIKKLYFSLVQNKILRNIFIFIYKVGGRKPWGVGYYEYKWEMIKSVLRRTDLLNYFKKKKIPKGFGFGLDERIVEYPWVFSNLNIEKKNRILDAGSVFNFKDILDSNLLRKKDVTIFTYYPELINFHEKRISYVYGDLRFLPFKNENFEEIVCQSTIEHVGMDNSIYGYESKGYEKRDKSYEYLKVVEELYRVLKKNGILLITFPFGKFKNYGFFQQFDSEMISRIRNILYSKGNLEIDFMKYTRDGWNFSTEKDCQNLFSYDLNTGEGKSIDKAAHSRAVCLIKFKNK